MKLPKKIHFSCQAATAVAEAEVVGAAAEAATQAEVRRLFTHLHLYLFINFPSILPHSWLPYRG